MNAIHRARARARSGLLALVLSPLSALAASGCSSPPGGPADAPAPPAESTPTPGSSEGGSPEPSGAPTRSFADLDAFFDQQLASGGLNGLAMQIYDASDKLVYEREAGVCATTPACPPGRPAFTVDLVTGIASSSKWVTSTVVLSVLEEQVALGRASSLDAALDAKLAPKLGCDGLAGPVADITTRQLLSFTSGLLPDHECVNDTSTTPADCACAILLDSAAALVASPTAGSPRTAAHPPGTTFKYGPTHLTVATALVERITRESWADVFDARIRAPLGVAMTYKNTKNAAASLQASVSDVARFVGAVFHDGRGDQPKRLLSRAAVEEQRASQVPSDAEWLIAPQEGTDYGLNVWRWCYDDFELGALQAPSTVAKRPACDRVFQVGHGGKGGYQPFLDAGGRYYAVLAIREESPGGGADYTAEQVRVTERARLLTHLAMTR